MFEFVAVRSSSIPIIPSWRAGRRKPSDSSFSSVLLSSRRREIWCHSLFEFVRLRSFPVIHRILAIISPRFSGCSSLIEFDAVRSNPQLCEWFPDSAPRPKVNCDSLPFVTFLTFCSKIFSSVLLSPSRHKIWCHSLIKFVRLRPFPVIHRVLAIMSPVFFGCSSLSQFDRVRKKLLPEPRP